MSVDLGVHKQYQIKNECYFASKNDHHDCCPGADHVAVQGTLVICVGR